MQNSIRRVLRKRRSFFATGLLRRGFREKTRTTSRWRLLSRPRLPRRDCVNLLEMRARARVSLYTLLPKIALVKSICHCAVTFIGKLYEWTCKSCERKGYHILKYGADISSVFIWLQVFFVGRRRVKLNCLRYFFSSSFRARIVSRNKRRDHLYRISNVHDLLS